MIVLQDYIPTYRLQFFDLLDEALRLVDIHLQVVVAASGKGRDQVHYDKSGLDRSWLRESRFKMSSRTPRMMPRDGNSDYVEFSDLVKADVVVTGLLGSSFMSNRLILRRKLRAFPRVAVWGHIGSYVAPAHPLDLLIETGHMRAADAVFAYTRGGARAALARRIPSDKIFVLNNTTASFQNRRGNEQFANHLRSRLPVDADSTPWVCFIGAFAAAKRIDFLADVLDELWKRGSRIRLIAGGGGVESSRLDRGVSRGQVFFLGHVSDDDKQAISAVVSVILCPGRVGLLAVDALRMGTPIATLASSMHAPEIEYLTEGVDVFFCEKDSVDAYATMIESLVERPTDPAVNDTAPSLGNMVSQFVAGIQYALKDQATQ